MPPVVNRLLSLWRNQDKNAVELLIEYDLFAFFFLREKLAMRITEDVSQHVDLSQLCLSSYASMSKKH